MSYSGKQILLGEVLRQAGLVSAKQVNQALKLQKQIDGSLTIGEILAKEGSINPQTIDFFADRWSKLAREKQTEPIGQYLKQAALLNEQQIQAILAEQLISKRKFGEVAIAKGWIKQTTLDFFLNQLKTAENSLSTVNSMAMSQQSQNFSQELSKLDIQQDSSEKVHEGFLQIKRKLLKIEGQGADSEKILEQVLSWTNGHSLLTQKLFTLITQTPDLHSWQSEQKQIDHLVRSKIINNWSNNELKSHLSGIETRLLRNPHCSSRQLLQLYQKVLTEAVEVDNSQEQQELINTGLVLKQDDQLVVANDIYQCVFNYRWVEEKLNLQPQLRGEEYSLTPTTNSQAIVKTSPSIVEPRKSWFNLRNFLLLLSLIGLLTIFFNNIFKRIAIKTSFEQGNLMLKQKSYVQAVEKYNQLLNIDSNYFQAWTNRGYALAGLKQYEAMRESCSTASIINPAAVYAWNCQGEALHNLKRDQEAIAAFDQAISLNQTDPIFLINKSESLEGLGDNQGSIDSIQQAIKILEQIEATSGRQNIQGEFAVALTFLGNSYRQQNKFDQAIASYERAINYSPSYFPARVGKGITLSKAKRTQAAELEFKSILQDSQLTPIQQSQTWFYLGKTFCQTGASAKGRDAFNQAVKLQPDYKIAKIAKQQCR